MRTFSSEPARPAAGPKSTAPAAAKGLGPQFLEANIPGPTPGMFAPVPAELPPEATIRDTPIPAGDPGGGGGSGPGSSGGRRWTIPTPVKDIRSGPFETVARGLFRAAGGLLNNRVQVDDDDSSFIPDAEDDKLFAPAAGRIAARHMPLPDKADLSELEDIGVAVVAILNWAGKGLISAWDARAGKRRARALLKGTGAAVYAGGPGDMQEQTR